MTREERYTEQLQTLGLYHEAFAPVIHQLSEVERDYQRIRKAWKDEGSAPDSKHLPVIQKMRSEMLSLRDALGLTPKSLRRLTAQAGDREAAAPQQLGSPVAAALVAGLRAQAEANSGQVSESDRDG